MLPSSTYTEDEALQLLTDCGIRYPGYFYQPTHLPPLIDLAYISVSKTTLTYVYAYDYDFSNDPLLKKTVWDNRLTLFWILDPEYGTTFQNLPSRSAFVEEQPGFFVSGAGAFTRQILWEQKDSVWCRADVPVSLSLDSALELCRMEQVFPPAYNFRANGEITFIKDIIPWDKYSEDIIYKKRLEIPLEEYGSSGIGYFLFARDLNLWFGTIPAREAPEQPAEIIRYHIPDDTLETIWTASEGEQIRLFSVDDTYLIWTVYEPVGPESELMSLRILNRNTGETTSVDLPWNQNGNYSFERHEDKLYYTVPVPTEEDEVQTHLLMQLDLADGSVTQIADRVEFLQEHATEVIWYSLLDDQMYILKNGQTETIPMEDVDAYIITPYGDNIQSPHNINRLELIMNETTDRLANVSSSSLVRFFNVEIDGNYLIFTMQSATKTITLHPMFYDIDRGLFVELDDVDVSDESGFFITQYTGAQLFFYTRIYDNPDTCTLDLVWVDVGSEP